MNEKSVCQQCGKLDYLKFAVTYRCNLDCRFCLQQQEKKVDLDWGVFQRTISDPEVNKDLRLVIFTGGEPLVWPYIDQAIALCKKIGIKEIGLFTNGVLLTDQRVAQLKESGVDWFRISIYGSKARINDGFLRGSGHSFERIINALEALKRHGFRRKVRVTIMKPNVADTERIIKKMHALGVEEFDFRVFSPTSIAEIDRDYQLSREDVKEVMPLILKYQEKYKDSMEIKCLPGTYDFLFKKTVPDASAVAKCACGRTYFGVTAEGNVRVCFGIHDNLGNLRKDNLAKLWKGSPELEKIRTYETADECRACLFRRHCKGSDCFAASYNRFGDINHKNPLCPLDKPLTSVSQWEKWKRESI